VCQEGTLGTSEGASRALDGVSPEDGGGHQTTLEHTGVTARVAREFATAFSGDSALLAPAIIITSALGSAFVDNVVFVAAFAPVVDLLNQNPLWWALLFGACFGGNITMIGSTANIVALGMLEKRYRINIKFFEWFKVGLVIGLISCLIAWGALIITGPKMPEREAKKTGISSVAIGQTLSAD